MRQILAILTSLCFVGCTLSESVKTDITPMPTLRVGYNIARLSDMRVYVFDNDGLLLQNINKELTPQTSISKTSEELLTLDLLRGVPQTSYTVISYANSADINFTPMTIGSSRIEDLQLQLTQRSNKDQAPELLYSKEKINVSRTDQIKTNIASLGKLYQQIELLVTGLELADKPSSIYRAELSELPMAYDAHGASSQNQGIYIPTLSLEGDTLKDSFRTFRLSSAGFHIRFWEGDRSLVDVQIKISDQAITQDILQIKVVILSTQISIWVGDWEYVITDTPGIGG